MSDRHRGITHVAFTVLLCVFPIAFLLTDVLWLVNLRNLRRTHYAVNVLGRLWLVGLISHWFFTGAAVVSCAFLLFRPVSHPHEGSRAGSAGAGRCREHWHSDDNAILTDVRVPAVLALLCYTSFEIVVGNRAATFATDCVPQLLPPDPVPTSRRSSRSVPSSRTRRRAHHDGDGEIRHVTAKNELPEAFQHGHLPRLAPYTPG